MEFKRRVKTSESEVTSLALNCGWEMAEESVGTSEDLIALLMTHLLSQNQQKEAFSILKRLDIPKFNSKHAELLKKDYKEIPNSLFTSDKFEPSGRADPSRPISIWFSMKDCDMQESDVTLIDTEQTLSSASQKILKTPKGQFIGFDSESFDPKLNDREGHLALIQIATKDYVFLFDCVSLKDSGEFHRFLEKFFTTKEFKILAHTFEGDIGDINMTFRINIDPNACGNVVDLTKVAVYTNGYNIGLAKMVELFLNKKLCK
jgi:hypothetical protein